MNLALDFPHGLDILRVQISIDRSRKSTHQKVTLEGVHDLRVHGLIQRFLCLELLAQHVNRKRIHAVGIKEFFKVKREHAHFANAPIGNRWCLRKCYS